MVIFSGDHIPRPFHVNVIVSGDVPRGTMVKTLRFHCSSTGSTPDLGTKTPHGVAKNINKAIAKSKKNSGVSKIPHPTAL